MKTRKVRKKGSTMRALRRDISLWLFCVPGVVLTFIFSYIPMYGVQLAFRRYNAKAGIWGSPWVGLYYFKRFFESPYFASTIKNTLILSLYGLVVSFPIPIILALLLNSFRHKRYRKVIQTVTYAPNFISTVVMCGMIILFLSPSVGVINNVVRFLGGDPVNFMAKKSTGAIFTFGPVSGREWDGIPLFISRRFPVSARSCMRRPSVTAPPNSSLYATSIFLPSFPRQQSC